MLRVGVVGTGAIGTEHARTLATRVAGVTVTAVYDLDRARAASVAGEIGAVALDRAEAVIHSDDVDALVLASPSPTHAAQVLACIEAGKPVLCEKPLAQSVEECIAVVRAEAAAGRHLVQLGFMRRFDPGYLEVKRAIDSGSIGTPLVAHCVHRNADVPSGFQTSMTMTDSVIHEFDVVRWLLDDDIAAVRVLFPKPTPNAPDMADPQIAIIEMASGVIVTVEAFLMCGFGYEVRCEVVGSHGLATLDHPRLSSVTSAGTRREVVADTWMTRFGDTYRIELQAWADAVRDGRSVGAGAWDGYAATAAANAAVRAQQTGGREPVTTIERPAFYS